jgi:hypothetical protein
VNPVPALPDGASAHVFPLPLVVGAVSRREVFLPFAVGFLSLSAIALLRADDALSRNVLAPDDGIRDVRIWLCSCFILTY